MKMRVSIDLLIATDNFTACIHIYRISQNKCWSATFDLYSHFRAVKPSETLQIHTEDVRKNSLL